MNPRKRTTSQFPAGKSSANRRNRKCTREPPLPESFHLLVKCRDESQQRELYERLTAEGHHCRVLSL